MDYDKELSQLLDIVIAEGASDLHVSNDRYPTIRVSGQLVPLVKRKVYTKTDTEGLMKALLTKDEQASFVKNKEIDLSYAYKDRARFRCNGYYEMESVSLAFRLIPRHIKTLEELNLPPILATFAQRQQGFFLVVGPVGQGKTTTLASMVDVINTQRAEHIVTIEDPIEYVFEQKKSIIDQREVGVDTADFATALKSAFRQDIDVLMIGEMRGPETISAAVTASETGHLVLSTLHTNNASQTIDRIIDTFPSGQQDQIKIQLAGSLSGIFSQRLVPRVSGGVIPVFELMINNTATANLIREGRTHEIDSVIQTSFEKGMIDMNRSLVTLVERGEITIETARAYSLNPQLLEKLV